jgi:hypothetical protein
MGLHHGVNHVSSLVVTLLILFLNAAGCICPIESTQTDDDLILKQIVQDLNLTEGSTTLRWRTNSDTADESRGPREGAIVLTRQEAIYTLRYAVRDSHGDSLWKLWIKHDIGEDGTGLSSPAVQEFLANPRKK